MKTIIERVRAVELCRRGRGRKLMVEQDERDKRIGDGLTRVRYNE